MRTPRELREDDDLRSTLRKHTVPRSDIIEEKEAEEDALDAVDFINKGYIE